MAFESLSEFAAIIPENLKGFSTAFPKIVVAAEAVHQGFQSLLNQHVRLDPSNIPLGTAIMMGFGAHSAWINAYVLSASGHVDSGWADMRRAIEFGCYAAKVVRSKKRAEDWMNQRTDRKARIRFASSCAIPLCYKSQDYRSLRPLLVAYESANYYGAHGNFESLVHKYFGTKDGTMLLSYQANREAIPRVTGLIILLGYRLLQVSKDILTPSIEEKSKLDSVMDFVCHTIREARLNLAEHDYQGFIPDHVLETIYKDEQEEIDRLFDELIEKESERKAQKQEITHSKD